MTDGSLLRDPMPNSTVVWETHRTALPYEDLIVLETHTTTVS